MEHSAIKINVLILDFYLSVWVACENITGQKKQWCKLSKNSNIFTVYVCIHTEALIYSEKIKLNSTTHEHGCLWGEEGEQWGFQP